MAKKKKKTKSKSSPKDAKRGCICEDGTYHVDCCDGSLQAQGIGSTVSQGISVKSGKIEKRVKSNNH